MRADLQRNVLALSPLVASVISKRLNTTTFQGAHFPLAAVTLGHTSLYVGLAGALVDCFSHGDTVDGGDEVPVPAPGGAQPDGACP